MDSRANDPFVICQQPIDDVVPLPAVQRVTVHHIKGKDSMGGDVLLLHFNDGGHLSYRLEDDDDGGIRFVAAGEILTRLLLAEVERGEISRMLG